MKRGVVELNLFPFYIQRPKQFDETPREKPILLSYAIASGIIVCQKAIIFRGHPAYCGISAREHSNRAVLLEVLVQVHYVRFILHRQMFTM